MEKLFMFIMNSFTAAWWVFLESSAYMLFGFFIAGLLYLFLKPEKVARYFGGRGVRPVVLAALAGIPIPLCSCGVIPAAAGLKKQGASRSATLSFLISTPETGMDSIPITYALIDPLMTVIRPVAAFFTAVVAGLTESLFGYSDKDTVLADQLPAAAIVPEPGSGGIQQPAQPRLKKLSDGLQYAFVELLGDIGPGFIFGVLLAGVILTAVPDDLIGGYLGNPLLAMFAMLLAGVPMYVCATASTPIAAALILKGLNPGAALVFLLVGPATNVATLSMVSGMLGKRSVVIYLAAIVVCAFAMGLFTDFLYATFQIQPTATAGQAGEILPEWLKTGAAFLLILLLGYAFRRTRKSSAGASCSCTDACCTK